VARPAREARRVAAPESRPEAPRRLERSAARLAPSAGRTRAERQPRRPDQRAPHAEQRVPRVDRPPSRAVTFRRAEGCITLDRLSSEERLRLARRSRDAAARFTARVVSNWESRLDSGRLSNARSFRSRRAARTTSALARRLGTSCARGLSPIERGTGLLGRQHSTKGRF